MAFVTLAEAASVVGVNKATLWRAIKQGRLSAHREANRTYRIEESELLRVFPINDKPSLSNAEAVALASPATLQIAALKAQVEVLQRQLNDLQRDKQWLMQRVETLEATQQRLLPGPKKPFLDRLAEALSGLRRR